LVSRRVLVLSTTTGYQLRSFGRAAERLGVELVFATDRCRNLDDPWQDSAIPVRFHDHVSSLDAIVRAAHERPIDGVLAVGDRPVVLAALAAEVLGVPGNPPGAAATSANKLLARERFAAAGLPVPWFVTRRLGDPGLATRDSGLATSERGPGPVSFPCVVKPLGLSGSRGVIRSDTPAEFARAITRLTALLRRQDVRAIRAGMEDEILVEGFIPGQEYALEGVLTAGKLQVFAIFDKPDPLDGPFFEETIYVTPSRLCERKQRAVVEQVQRGVTALGLRHGPVHAECRVGPGGVFILEIAARPIGGLCSAVIRFADGQSLEDVLLRHALGDDVSACVVEAGGAGVMMIPIPKRGIYKSVKGETEARRVPGVYDVRITAKPDQLVETLPEAGSYLGFIFARAATAGEAEAALREAHRRLSFAIDPAIPVSTGW
jgi:biotin carboxylase